MGTFDPSSATPVDAPPSAPFDPSSAQLVDSSPGIGAGLLGLADAGMAGANQLVVGTLGGIARTVNRVLPEALVGGAGSKAQAQADIDALQEKLTYHPQSALGQQIGNAVSGVVAPVAGAAAGVVGAVVGKDNTPAVMDALSLLGLKGYDGLVPSAGDASATLRAARAADQANRAAGRGTLGLATGNPTVQAAEQALARTPLVGGKLKAAIADSNTQLGVNANEIIQNLAQGADTSPQAVGKILGDQVRAASDNAKAVSSKGYADIQNMLPEGGQSSIPVANAQKVLRSLTQIDGAPATSEAIVPSDIRSMAQALEKDAGLAGELPYEAVQKLRTAVGQKIDWSPFTANPSNGMLKTVYGSLTRDLNDGASSFGSDVAKVVSDNNVAYAKAAAQRNALQGVMEKAGGPEKVYNALFNTTKDGSSTLDAVLRFTSPPTQRLLAASVLERMGNALPGAQDAAGSVFSADRFLSNWARMSPEAKQSLFGSLPGGYSQSITDLANNVSRLKAYGKVLGSRSPAFGPLATTGGAVGLVEAMAHGLVGFKTLGAAYGANKALGLALTNPQTASALARISGDLTDNAVKYIARTYSSANVPPQAH